MPFILMGAVFTGGAAVLPRMVASQLAPWHQHEAARLQQRAQVAVETHCPGEVRTSTSANIARITAQRTGHDCFNAFNRWQSSAQVPGIPFNPAASTLADLWDTANHELNTAPWWVQLLLYEVFYAFAATAVAKTIKLYYPSA